MPDIVIKKVLSSQPLLTEPKNDSNQVIFKGVPLRVFAGEKVKTGAQEAVTETIGGAQITWVFVEATEGNNVDKRKGFVDDGFLVGEDVVTPVVVGQQPFSEQVGKEEFAVACVVQADAQTTNPAYLYALAFAQSGTQWTADKVQTNDPADAPAFGVYRFTKKTWAELLKLVDLNDLVARQIKFPEAQCIVAAVLASKAADLIKGRIGDRGVSAVDLYLAHVFADDGSFGSNAAVKIIDAERSNSAQKSVDVVRQIYPDDALRAGFLSRNQEIFKQDGGASIKEALDKCTEKLVAGFNKVKELALDIKKSIPADMGDPVMGGGDIQAKPGKHQVVVDKLIAGAKSHGLDPMTVLTFIAIESDFDPLQCSPLSSAAGLFQFLDDTWRANGGPEFPGRGGKGNGHAAGATVDMQVEIGCKFTADNMNKLKAALGKTPTVTMLYMAHQQGLAGALKILNAKPEASIESVIGVAAAQNNRFGGLTVRQTIDKFGVVVRSNEDEARALVTIKASSAQISSEGPSLDGRPVASKAVGIALTEMEKFARRNGAVVLETQEPLRSRVLEYFKLVGRPDITNPAAEAWSAAFISSVMTSAGAAPTQFPISAGHSRYILFGLSNRIANRMNASVVYFDKDEMAPRVGDLIGFSRTASVKNRADLERLLPDTFFRSHTNVVIDVSPGKIKVIGGNLSQTIQTQTVKTNAAGQIDPSDQHFFVLQINI